MWEVEDVLEIWGEGEEECFFVKWKNWDGLVLWIDIVMNLEIVVFVRKYLVNFYFCILNKMLLNLYVYG